MVNKDNIIFYASLINIVFNDFIFSFFMIYTYCLSVIKYKKFNSIRNVS